MANHRFTDPVGFSNNDVITGGNFAQLYPNTEIMKTLTLTITGGNWINVKKQPQWTVTGGLWLQKNRCTNRTPRLIDAGHISCTVDCEHLVNSEDISMDGVVVDTIRDYEDEVL